MRQTLILLLTLAVSAHGAAQPPTASDPRPTLVDRIDSFGFGSKMSMGVGGALTVRIYPIVLFKNGDALTDVEALADPAGLERHKRDHAAAWTSWRRGGDGIELRKGDAWSPLPFKATYGKLPDGFRLDGEFRALTGAGTLAIGGTQEVSAVSEYRFSSDGRVERGGAVGSRTADTGTSVATSVASAARHGSYTVEGLELVLRWSDGTVERRVLITDPADPKASIWLDGEGYARRTPRR